MRNKVVIITGASSGIGRALARLFASAGSKVAVAARRLDRLNELEEEFGSENLLVVKTDVCREEDCRNLIERTVEKFGGIDILINNAGVSLRASFLNCELSVLHQIMDVNFWGTVYCTKYALPYLLTGKGSLVGIVSVLGYYGAPGRSGYSASKFAVRGLLDSIRVENRSKKLHVLSVSPGLVNSEVRISTLLYDGTVQGKSPRVKKNMMSAEKCALLIYRGIKRRKQSLILSLAEGKIAIFLSKWCLPLVDRINYFVLKREPECPF
jgi:short-subunit dehydrogenase